MEKKQSKDHSDHFRNAILDSILNKVDKEPKILNELERLGDGSFVIHPSTIICVPLSIAQETIRKSLDILKKEAVNLVCPILANCETVNPEDIIYLETELDKHLTNFIKDAFKTLKYYGRE